MFRMRKRCLLTGALLSLFAVVPTGQTRQAQPDTGLFKTLSALDTELFNAFNTCDLEKFESLFADDVEFYHDTGGVMRTKQAVTASIKSNICGKVRRDLVAGSMEVHPMDGFGAVQIGIHRFCESKLPKCEPAASGIARFIHLWQLKDGVWKITRVISYDHVSSR